MFFCGFYFCLRTLGACFALKEKEDLKVIRTGTFYYNNGKIELDDGTILVYRDNIVVFYGLDRLDRIAYGEKIQ